MHVKYTPLIQFGAIGAGMLTDMAANYGDESFAASDAAASYPDLKAGSVAQGIAGAAGMAFTMLVMKREYSRAALFLGAFSAYNLARPIFSVIKEKIAEESIVPSDAANSTTAMPGRSFRAMPRSPGLVQLASGAMGGVKSAAADRIRMKDR